MEKLHEAKKLIKQIVETGFVDKKPLGSEQKLIGEEIQKTAYQYFTEIKSEYPSYTIDKNPLLKRYLVDEEADGKLDLQVLDYFSNNAEAFHEIIAYKFCGQKKRKTKLIENHIFYMRLFSSICSQEYDVYVVYRKNNFYLFENRVTEAVLIEYLNHYFVELSNDTMEGLTELSKQGNLKHGEMQARLNAVSEKINQESKSNDYKLQVGAITFMDFLGWKGLWQSNHKNHLETVSGLIRNMEQKAQELTRDMFEYSSNLKLSRLISISDTIAIFTPKLAEKTEIELLELHAEIARYILEECVKNGYAIRGAICFGEYNTKDNIMIGPGIDECASWHELCDWIGVHLTPSAELLINANQQKPSGNIFRYGGIPIKKGYPKVLYCVQWEVAKERFMELANNVKALLPEISSKYMNTYDFLYGKENGHG